MNAQTETNSDHPIAAALREAGFIPLPRLWVKREQMTEIHRIAEESRVEVNNIRAAARRLAEAEPDPVTDKDAAWKAYDALRAAEQP